MLNLPLHLPVSSKNLFLSACFGALEALPRATRLVTSASSLHPLPSLAAVTSAPEKRNMPFLHPRRLNRAFGGGEGRKSRILGMSKERKQ
ncbi:hypothetical protein F2Q69_00048846 [Brassica cretica]|uniref:Uncharacterized protein n=1 Tax=Brassica cretica TaxID=69181 RepID=A0A8S9PUE9_BRACR|nr:hypothetical protein F2Q69_00048846 [Brassica cretica]